MSFMDGGAVVKMGRGSKTKESEVIKGRPSRIGSGQGSSTEGENHADTCLFSFSGTVSVLVNKANGIKPGATVVVLTKATNPSILELYVGGKSMGSPYFPKLQKILDCIKKGYSYEGVVQNVRITTTEAKITFSVQGFGR